VSLRTASGFLESLRDGREVWLANVQNDLREMITVTEMVRAAILAAESDPVPGPNGTIAPNPRYLGQERFYFLASFPRLLEIVRTLGAGGLMVTPSEAEVRGPLAPDIAPRWLGSMAATRYPLQDELKQRIWALLARARAWDARPF
jgi:hypothetical protein